MDGGCCIARYGGYGGRYGLSKAERIMLRFRPIAPKPSTDGCSGGSSGSPEKYSTTKPSGGGRGGTSPGKLGRGKRKYPKETTSSGDNTRRKRSSTKSVGDSAVTTLSLLPERPENNLLFPDLNVSPVSPLEKRKNGPMWLSFSHNGPTLPYKTAEISRRTVVVSSCVTVERLTDAWIDGYGKTDDEKKMNLMRDTCPGFISDAVGNVTWTNEAYNKMAKEDVNIPMEESAPENNNNDFHVIVRLVMKEKPMMTYPSFTCRVRLQYTCRDRERGGSVTVVPCDVWRMDGGGFAWRLDVKAALCL